MMAARNSVAATGFRSGHSAAVRRAAVATLARASR
jgi:hypothetical protein